MFSSHRIWRDLSVSSKLYAVVGVMGLLIITELFTLRFAMNTLSSVRAFVGGEGLWSKGQKTAIIALHRFAVSRKEADFQAFRSALEVPLGDREARLALAQPILDRDAVRKGMLRGRIHPDDIDGLINLVRRFHNMPYVKRTLATWARADELMELLEAEGDTLAQAVRSNQPPAVIDQQMEKIGRLNDQFTIVEDEFSFVLGEGSRWLEGVVMTVLVLLVLTVESTGVFLTVSFSRTLSKSLNELCEAAARVGRGVFAEKLPVRSNDELGRLAQALNAMTSQLQESMGQQVAAERANATKSAFLANMSHEIRTPMGAILGFASLLDDPKLSAAERSEFVRIIERSGQGLIRVIDDILDLSKVEAGALTIENLEFSVSAVLEDVVDLLHEPADRKGIELLLEVDPSADVVVCSDPTRLRQVVTNIVGNAVKFTDQGRVRVHAQLTQRPSVGDVVSISVEDSGIGLTHDQLQKLFEPFSQADGSTTRKYGGTGLGLVLSRKLARALGGEVRCARSRPAEGSEFVIEIPTQLSRPVAAEVSHPFSQERIAFLGGRVLVVDDCQETGALLRKILENQGLSVEIAMEGQQAIDLALKTHYDLILMDLQMPGLDGIETLRRLQALHYSAPVIALTAHAMRHDRQRCLAAGFVDHLTKPLDVNELLRAIHRHTGVGASLAPVN